MKYLVFLITLTIFFSCSSDTKKNTEFDQQQSKAIDSVIAIKENSSEVQILFEDLKSDLNDFFDLQGEPQGENTLRSYAFVPSETIGDGYAFLVKYKDTIWVNKWSGYYPDNRKGHSVKTIKLFPDYQSNYRINVILVKKSFESESELLEDMPIVTIDEMKAATNIFRLYLDDAKKDSEKDAERISSLMRI